jgi:hypothetical protein
LVLALLATVAAAYLFTHLFANFLQRRFGLITGIEYVLLGVLLGPMVVEDVYVFGDLNAIAPAIAFAAGWVGLLYGLELRGMAESDDRSIRLALVVGLGTMLGVTGAARWLLGSGLLLEAIESEQAWMSAGVLGCAAAAGSSSAVELMIAERADEPSRLLSKLKRSTRFTALLAIVVFGVLFCVFHQGDTHLLERDPVAAEWVLLTLGLGVVLGIFFTFFLGDDQEEPTRFLALVGIIVFASGAAFFLNLSALLVNLLLGAVIAQTARCGSVQHTLQSTRQPARLILLLFAGALWVPSYPAASIVLFLGFVGLRLLLLFAGSWSAAVGTGSRTDLYRGLLSQGDVAVAMAVSFRLVYAGPAVDLVYTTILAAAVVHEMVAPYALRRLLADAGELPDAPTHTAALPPRRTG